MATISVKELFTNVAEQESFVEAFGKGPYDRKAIINKELLPLPGAPDKIAAMHEMLPQAARAAMTHPGSIALVEQPMTKAQREAVLKKAQGGKGKAGLNLDVMSVEYLAIGKQVRVPGTLISFQDQYEPTWNTESVYGRMDPLVTYQGTSRKISIAYQVDLEADAFAVGGGVGDLIKFLYPAYQGASKTQLGTGTLSAPPLWRLKMQKNTMIGGARGLLLAVDQFDLERFTSGQKDEQTAYYDNTGHFRPTQFTFTLGGYVFHEDAKPGWTYRDVDASGKSFELLEFGPGNSWPYAQQPMYYDSDGRPSFATTDDVVEALQAENLALAGQAGGSAEALKKAQQAGAAAVRAHKQQVKKIINGSGSGRHKVDQIKKLLK